MPTNPDVDAWFDAYENPMRDVMLAIRSVILQDDRITETIKWNAPTFMYKGWLVRHSERAELHLAESFDHMADAIDGVRQMAVGEHPDCDIHELIRRAGDVARDRCDVSDLCRAGRGCRRARRIRGGVDRSGGCRNRLSVSRRPRRRRPDHRDLCLDPDRDGPRAWPSWP